MVAILSDIGNWLSGAIQWLTQSAPKPFKILFFLVLITLGALILTFTIRMLGYHCNSEAVPYHVSPLNLFGNWELLTNVPDVARLQENAYSANDLPPSITGGNNLKKCSVAYTNGNYTRTNGQVIQFDTPMYFFDGQYCTACEKVNVNHGQALLGGDLIDTLCLGNVQYLPLINKTWTQKNIYCGDSGYCQPPIGYYWRASDNTYVCTDTTICGNANMSVSKYWNRRIIEAGGTPLYPAGFVQGFDTESVFSIQCTSDLKAQFTIWQIPIFDYKIWLVLTLILGLLSFYKWHT
jgi:hypothetical protein